MTDVSSLFLTESARVLRDHYLPKIKEAVSLLSDAEIWAREGDAANSIGNLLLHLAGNVRQHVIGGLGGAKDERNRPLEFAARGGVPKAALLSQLEATVLEAVTVLESFPPEKLLEEREIQGKRVVLLNDLLHVVEHFAYHCGQIFFIVKAFKQHDFGWYKYLDGK